MNPGTNSSSLFNRNKPELLIIFFVTKSIVKMTEQCRLLKHLPKPKFYASNKQNMSGQKMTCGNTAVKWLYEFRESQTAREEPQTLPSERALAKEMAHIHFRRHKGFRIRNTCVTGRENKEYYRKLNTRNTGYKKERHYIVMSNTNVQTLLNFRLTFLELEFNSSTRLTQKFRHFSTYITTE